MTRPVSASFSARWSVRALPNGLRLVLGVGVITASGFVWVAQSDALAATGQRIQVLQASRAELVEQRAEALIVLARATDPRQREDRARAMGYGPAGDVTEVAVDRVPAAPPRRDGIAADSALALVAPRPAMAATPSRAILAAIVGRGGVDAIATGWFADDGGRE